MSAAEIVADLARRGIRLEAYGERLRYYPRSALTPDLLDRLKANKAELLAFIERFEERAAIMEYDGGLSRPEAERLAWPQPLGDIQPEAQPLDDAHEWREYTTADGGRGIERLDAPPRIDWSDAPQPRKRPAEAADWPSELADWVLTLTADDLPAVPFTLAAGRTVVDAARWLGRLQADIRRGPAGPRARYGALQDDLRRLLAIAARFAAE